MRETKDFATLTALVLLCFIADTASATDVCSVQKSADGYVALRAMPSSRGAVLVRAKEGQALIIQKSSSGEQIISGRWMRVLHFTNTVVPQQTDPAFKRGTIGWMHQHYVGDCG